jgi:hypothetical protein
MGIDLMKRVEKVGIVLEKRNIKDIPCQVKLAIDRSGSMDWLYQNNTVQDVVERILAIGMNFDVDKTIDVWAFHTRSFELEPATPKNIDGYVKKHIINKIESGGTAYAPAMEDIINSSVSTQKKGLFGGLFGKKTVATDEYPTLAIFITDGENSDEAQAERLIKASQDKNIYWVLIGIGRSDFFFIRKMGDVYPNCGYFPISDLSAIDDEDLYSEILNDEFSTWIKKFKK